MEPEILKFEDILKGCLKRWKEILVVAIFTTILATIVSGPSHEIITYEGDFKVLIKNVLVDESDNINVSNEDNKIQNIIQLIKTRDFLESAIKLTNLAITPQEVLKNLTVVNIDKSDFIQIKYVNEDYKSTEEVIEAIKEEIVNVLNGDVELFIAEDVGITEMVNVINNKIFIPIGFIGGLSIAFVIVFVFECINKTFKTKGEIERELKVPIISSIPKVKKGQSISIIENKNDTDFIRAFNSLIIDIKYRKKNELIKTIAITSSISGEGSSVVASNLALDLSNSNKILLIDCNYEKPRLNSIFNVSSDLGLVDVILNNKNLDDVILNYNKNLDLLLFGESEFNTISLLDSKALDELLDKVREKYEYIVIDTPALQAACEIKALLKKVDANILVVKAESTKKDDVKFSIKEMDNIGINLIGIAFNFADRFRNKYYNYKHN